MSPQPSNYVANVAGSDVVKATAMMDADGLRKKFPPKGFNPKQLIEYQMFCALSAESLATLITHGENDKEVKDMFRAASKLMKVIVEEGRKNWDPKEQGHAVAKMQCIRSGCEYAQHETETHGYCCSSCKDGGKHCDKCAKKEVQKSEEELAGTLYQAAFQMTTNSTAKKEQFQNLCRIAEVFKKSSSDVGLTKVKDMPDVAESLLQYYANAKVVKEEFFEPLVTKIAASTTKKIKHAIGPLKHPLRVFEKAVLRDTDPFPKDIVRGQFICPDWDSIREAVQELVAPGNVHVIKVKNKFATVKDNWADFTMIIAFRGSGVSEELHNVACEVQICLHNMMVIREGIEPAPHDIYEEGRFVAEVLEECDPALPFGRRELLEPPPEPPPPTASQPSVAPTPSVAAKAKAKPAADAAPAVAAPAVSNRFKLELADGRGIALDKKDSDATRGYRCFHTRMATAAEAITVELASNCALQVKEGHHVLNYSLDNWYGKVATGNRQHFSNWPEKGGFKRWKVNPDMSISPKDNNPQNLVLGWKQHMLLVASNDAAKLQFVKPANLNVPKKAPAAAASPPQQQTMQPVAQAPAQISRDELFDKTRYANGGPREDQNLCVLCCFCGAQFYIQGMFCLASFGCAGCVDCLTQMPCKKIPCSMCDPNQRACLWCCGTPILWAAAFGQLHTVMALVKNGADPYAKALECSNTWNVAMKEKHWHVVAWLEDYKKVPQ